MRFKQVGNKRDSVILVVRNADTVALAPGQAAILNFPFKQTTGASANPGLDVVGANNFGTAFTGITPIDALLYGVVVSPSAGGIPVGGYGEVQVSGFCPNVQLSLMTRASTNSIWPSYASIAATLGMVPLYVESLANGFTTNAAQSVRTDAISTGNQAVFTQFTPAFVLGQSVASFTTQASSLAGFTAATMLTASVSAFLRLL